MALNPNLTNLDISQALIRCIDADNDAMRVELGAADFAIALDSSEDSVKADKRTDSSSADLTSANTGVSTQVVAPLDASNFSRANLYVQATAANAGTMSLKLQLSPAESGNIWIDSGVSVTIPAASAAVAMGTASSNIVAKRVRVVSSAALTGAETATVYLVLGS